MAVGVISDTAENLRLAALDAWRTSGIPDPAISYVTIGEVPIDDCCSGLLVITVDQLVWWNPFPFESILRSGSSGVAIPFADGDRCVGTYGAAATIHVARCIPTVDDRGVPPDPAAVQAAMMELLDLMAIVAKGVTCINSDCWVVGGATFNPPEGGCVVGSIAVRLDNCP